MILGELVDPGHKPPVRFTYQRRKKFKHTSRWGRRFGIEELLEELNAPDPDENVTFENEVLGSSGEQPEHAQISKSKPKSNWIDRFLNESEQPIGVANHDFSEKYIMHFSDAPTTT